jgi:hypothetical protein
VADDVMGAAIEFGIRIQHGLISSKDCSELPSSPSVGKNQPKM